MPLFWFNNENLKPVNEVEVDGQDMSQPEDQSTDYTVEDNSQGAPDQEPVPQDSEQQPENPQEPPAQAEEPVDYTEGSDDNDGGAPPAEQGGGEPAPQQPEEEQPVDDIKAQEEEMYSNLTDEQLDIKHKELKTRFLEMYDMTTEIVDRIGNATITEENIGVIEYISKNLNQLREMISDYVASIYQTKSYTENSINYNRFLAVLHGINKMLDELGKKED